MDVHKLRRLHVEGSRGALRLLLVITPGGTRGQPGAMQGTQKPGNGTPQSPSPCLCSERQKALRGTLCSGVCLVVFVFFLFSLHFLPPDSPPSAYPPRLRPRSHGKLTHFLRGLRIYPTSSLLPSSFPFKTTRKKRKGPCGGLSSVL